MIPHRLVDMMDGRTRATSSALGKQFSLSFSGSFSFTTIGCLYVCKVAICFPLDFLVQDVLMWWVSAWVMVCARQVTGVLASTETLVVMSCICK